MHHTADPTTLAPRRPDSASTRLIIWLDRWIYQFSGHWLLAFNAVSFVVVLGAVFAPVFRAAHWSSVADPIYRAFSGVCHQDPARSFHLAGHHLACCERCAAVYVSIALFGALFALVRTALRRPTYLEVMLLASPLVLDGMAVGAGLYDGNAVLRTVTGTLFGLACIWLMYPRFEAGFTGIRQRLEGLFERLAAQGRAAPLRQ